MDDLSDEERRAVEQFEAEEQRREEKDPKQIIMAAKKMILQPYDLVNEALILTFGQGIDQDTYTALKCIKLDEAFELIGGEKPMDPAIRRGQMERITEEYAKRFSGIAITPCEGEAHKKQIEEDGARHNEEHEQLGQKKQHL